MLVIQVFLADGGLYSGIVCGEGSGQYPHNEDMTIDTENKNHKLTVEVRGGHAAVITAECPGREHMHTAVISSAGSFVACIPEKTLIKIINDGGGDVDFIAG